MIESISEVRSEQYNSIKSKKEKAHMMISLTDVFELLGDFMKEANDVES
jgi:hypothetical protein